MQNPAEVGSIGTWATEKTHPLIGAFVPGSLSAIANASWSTPQQDRSRRRSPPGWPARASTARERHARSNGTFQAVDMHQRTDLYHPAEPSRRAASSNLEHRVETLRLEQVEAAKDLLGIRKGAVGD